MSTASRLLIVLLFGLLVAALLPAQQPKAPPTKEQIAQWIKDLGADDFDKREGASKQLWEAGQPAEAAVLEASKSKDEEVRRRATEILARFKYGIYPDTPRKVADLVLAFQTAPRNTQVNIIRELFEAGTPGCRALMKLANAEENLEARRAISNLIAIEMHRSVPALLAEGNYETLEMLIDLRLAGDVKLGAPTLTAYSLLRGQLDAAIDKVKNKKELDAKRQQEVLAFIYRGKGDLKAARAAAAQAGDAKLDEDLLVEASEWQELAKRFQSKIIPPNAPQFYDLGFLLASPMGQGHLLASPKVILFKSPLAGDIEKLGYGAAFHRLAGNRSEFDLTSAAIVKYAADAPGNDKSAATLRAAKALFLNDRPEEALKLLKNGSGDNLVFSFEILTVQMRFTEAFALLEQARRGGAAVPPQLEIIAAQTWHSLGEKDKAKALLTKLADVIKQGNDLSWFPDLVDAEFHAGLREEAFRHAAQVLDLSKDTSGPARLLPKLFPGRGDIAEQWFQHLQAATPNATRADLLMLVRALLDGKMPEKDMEKLLADGKERVFRVEEQRAGISTERERSFMALVDMALQYKQETTALALLEKAKTPATLRRLGDIYSEKKQWNKATEQYKAAWDKDSQQVLSLYLYGQALAASGKVAEGEKLMEQAHWLPLADESVRQTFLLALNQRGQTVAARRENDLLLRTGQPGSFQSGEALRRSALEQIIKKNFAKAADDHERAMLRCLSTRINFLQRGAYVRVPELVHRLRARGLLDVGKLEEARREIVAAQALMPGDTNLPILLVLELEKRGLAKEATAMFEQSLAICGKASKEYPLSASLHNSVAWLEACCGRNLESAKEHALKAVELEPGTPGFLDTLAEVYFQLGEQPKALVAETKAIEIDAKRNYYRKQLERMKAGDPKAERPLEDDDS